MSNEPINVSEDRLRGVLAEMELRLRDFFDARLNQKADRSVVEDALKRIEHGEKSAADRAAAQDDRIANLEKWKYGLTLLAASALAIAGYVLKYVP